MLLRNYAGWMRVEGRNGYLLDTNILIAIFERKPLTRPAPIGNKVNYISVITLGELHAGARISTRVGRNIERINAMMKRLELIKCTKGTAEHYGVLVHKLKGHPIPSNDIWIAATAIQYGLTLVTRDKHFNVVPDLTVEEW
jgi:tRNA(fMet)-specific endonuclease VapC